MHYKNTKDDSKYIFFIFSQKIPWLPISDTYAQRIMIIIFQKLCMLMYKFIMHNLTNRFKSYTREPFIIVIILIPHI